ncbi:hypothetical protein AAU61_09350 [Desulfocarbo indianensis]|nr:hypothetical protein AAU61_09350 [Desulfocarbo indianensis]
MGGGEWAAASGRRRVGGGEWAAASGRQRGEPKSRVGDQAEAVGAEAVGGEAVGGEAVVDQNGCGPGRGGPAGGTLNEPIIAEAG